MGESSQTQTQNQSQVNQDITKQIPEQILKGLEKHIVLAYKNSSKYVLVDLEDEKEKEEMYDRIAYKLSVLIRDQMEDYMEKSSFSDIIDVLKLYPYKKIFILTQLNHLQKHDLIELNKWVKENQQIGKYEIGLKFPSRYHYIGIDNTKPYAYGLGFFTVTLSKEDIEGIARVIFSEIFYMKGYQLDMVKDAGSEYTFTVFRKHWYIYRNTPGLKFLVERLTDDSDVINNVDDNYVVLKNKWLYLIEFHSDLLRKLMDP